MSGGVHLEGVVLMRVDVSSIGVDGEFERVNLLRPALGHFSTQQPHLEGQHDRG